MCCVFLTLQECYDLHSVPCLAVRCPHSQDGQSLPTLPPYTFFLPTIEINSRPHRAGSQTGTRANDNEAKFKCLVEGCDFQGKYHQMDLHRRRQHRKQELKDILFAEQRQNKKRLQAVKELLYKLSKKREQLEMRSFAAQRLFNASCKKCAIEQIIKMLQHIQICANEECHQVILQQTISFIGNRDKVISECHLAKQLMELYD